jgi:hypothetical protein
MLRGLSRQGTSGRTIAAIAFSLVELFQGGLNVAGTYPHAVYILLVSTMSITYCV